MKTRTRCSAVGLLAVALLAGGGSSVAQSILGIEATVSPNTIVLDSDTEWLTVHTDIALGAVATETLDLSGLAVSWTKADNRGNLVAKFDMEAVKGMVRPPSATLVLSGLTMTGVPFEGADTVVVKGSAGK